MAFSTLEVNLNLFPCVGEQMSSPVCDLKYNLEACENIIGGGLAGTALVRWLLLLKESAGFYSVSFVVHSSISKFSACTSADSWQGKSSSCYLVKEKLIFPSPNQLAKPVTSRSFLQKLTWGKKNS